MAKIKKEKKKKDAIKNKVSKKEKNLKKKGLSESITPPAITPEIPPAPVIPAQPIDAPIEAAPIIPEKELSEEEVDNQDKALENNLLKGTEPGENKPVTGITTTKNFAASLEAPLTTIPLEVKTKMVKIQVIKKRRCNIGGIDYIFVPGKDYEVSRNVMHVLLAGKILKRVY